MSHQLQSKEMRLFFSPRLVYPIALSSSSNVWLRFQSIDIINVTNSSSLIVSNIVRLDRKVRNCWTFHQKCKLERHRTGGLRLFQTFCCQVLTLPMYIAWKEGRNLQSHLIHHFSVFLPHYYRHHQKSFPLRVHTATFTEMKNFLQHHLPMSPNQRTTLRNLIKATIENELLKEPIPSRMKTIITMIRLVALVTSVSFVWANVYLLLTLLHLHHLLLLPK